jgi:hypothetical protein
MVRRPILVIRRCLVFALLNPGLFIVVGNSVVDKLVRVVDAVVYEGVRRRCRNVGVRRGWPPAMLPSSVGGSVASGGGSVV